MIILAEGIALQPERQETMIPAYLAADLLVVLHALYVGFVVGGLVVVWIGWAARWNWIRNFWFRMIHLGAIGLVAVEAVFGWTCPLTDWENRLREEAGQAPYPGDFLAYWAHRLLYWDAPQEFFWTLHILFFLIVVATFCLIPPRWPRHLSQSAE